MERQRLASERDEREKEKKRKAALEKAKVLRTFNQNEIKDALKFMWQLSKSGTKDAKEVSAYITKDKEGNLLFNIFDPEGNTPTTSQNPPWDPAETGEELLAQIHTHPDYLDGKGSALNGSEWPSDDADQPFINTYKIPMFIISDDRQGGLLIRSASGANLDQRYSPIEVSSFKNPERLLNRINKLREYLQGVI